VLTNDEMNESAIVVLLRAATFAAEKHKKQLRKNAGGTPYINAMNKDGSCRP